MTTNCTTLRRSALGLRAVGLGLAIGLAIVLAIVLATPELALAKPVTACTTLNICYCVNDDNRGAIDKNVARVRALIAEQRTAGKAIGYLSVPLSTLAGSYFGVNVDVARETKARIEKRFGARAVWILNAGAEGNLPPGASGADYMYMWTRILEGNGLGEDFDFFYFTGPSAFAQSLGLDGDADMEKLEAYFDKRLATDTAMQKAVADGKLSKGAFRNYYGLAASVAFSLGSHDEWNIARLLNERRRGASELGLARQLPVLFDGRAATPGDFEKGVAGGDTGRCIN
jgi:hypothetical protein